MEGWQDLPYLVTLLRLGLEQQMEATGRAVSDNYKEEFPDSKVMAHLLLKWAHSITANLKGETK